MTTVERLFADIADRRGLKWEWAKIEPDVKEEIRQAWQKIIDDENARLKQKNDEFVASVRAVELRRLTEENARLSEQLAAKVANFDDVTELEAAKRENARLKDKLEHATRSLEIERQWHEEARAENARLTEENAKLKAAGQKLVGSVFSGSDDRQRLEEENARLREKLDDRRKVTLTMKGDTVVLPLAASDLVTFTELVRAAHPDIEELTILIPADVRSRVR